MRVVSDADVLIHLSKLKKLSLLQPLYKEVAIPDYVKYEILIKEDTELQKALNSFLKVFTISKDKAVDIAKRHNIHKRGLVSNLHLKHLYEKVFNA